MPGNHRNGLWNGNLCLISEFGTVFAYTSFRRRRLAEWVRDSAGWPALLSPAGAYSQLPSRSAGLAPAARPPNASGRARAGVKTGPRSTGSGTAARKRNARGDREKVCLDPAFFLPRPIAGGGVYLWVGSRNRSPRFSGLRGRSGNGAAVIVRTASGGASLPAIVRPPSPASGPARERWRR